MHKYMFSCIILPRNVWILFLLKYIDIQNNVSVYIVDMYINTIVLWMYLHTYFLKILFAYK